MPVLQDFKSAAPQAICEEVSANVNRNLLINRDTPPFDNPRSAAGDGAEPGS